MNIRIFERLVEAVNGEQVSITQSVLADGMLSSFVAAGDEVDLRIQLSVDTLLPHLGNLLEEISSVDVSVRGYGSKGERAFEQKVLRVADRWIELEDCQIELDGSDDLLEIVSGLCESELQVVVFLVEFEGSARDAKVLDAWLGGRRIEMFGLQRINCEVAKARDAIELFGASTGFSTWADWLIETRDAPLMVSMIVKRNENNCFEFMIDDLEVEEAQFLVRLDQLLK